MSHIVSAVVAARYGDLVNPSELLTAIVRTDFIGERVSDPVIPRALAIQDPAVRIDFVGSRASETSLPQAHAIEAEAVRQDFIG